MRPLAPLAPAPANKNNFKKPHLSFQVFKKAAAKLNVRTKQSQQTKKPGGTD